MPFASALRALLKRTNLPEMFLRFLCVLAVAALALHSPAQARALGKMAGISPSLAVAERRRPVWIASNGFHSAFILRVEDLSPDLRLRLRDRQARWAVIGWGDRNFFMAKPPTVWMAVAAVFWPTQSALHVLPLRQPPELALARSDIVRLALPESAVARLRVYVDSQFARDASGRRVSLGTGFVPTSEFFLGAESFYFPKMCNVWTARGLRLAGVRVASPLAITAGGLMWQLTGSGQRTSSRQRPVDAF